MIDIESSTQVDAKTVATDGSHTTPRDLTNLEHMDALDFTGWNGPDWETFSHFHTDDVYVNISGTITEGLEEHVDAMKAVVEAAPDMKITAHPIAFGSGEWTCVVGEIAGGGRMVTVARWQDGQIAEEHIWM